MKVERFRQNYSVQQSLPQNLQNQQKAEYKPNFNGIKTPKFSDYVKQKGLVKFMEKLKWFDGEEGRILITAIGTGAIAPLFIAWNPYVKPKEGATEEEKKELKKTQKYTAWRQPVSAALAIPIQLSLVKPLLNGLDVLFNNSKYSQYIPTYLDKSALQDDKYIKRQETKKLKKSKLNKNDFKTKLAENVNSIKNAQIAAAADDLLKTGQIRIRQGADGLVDNKSIVDALKSEIRGYASDANFLMNDSLSDKDLEKIFNNPEEKVDLPSKGKNFYKDRAETLINNKDELKKVLETNFPKDKKEIKNYLQNQISQTSDEKLKDIYREIIALKDADSQASRCSRTIERIGTIEKICDGNYTSERYMTHMQEQDKELLKRIQNFAKIEKGIEENSESIKETIEKVTKNCHYDGKNAKLKRIFHDLTTFGENTKGIKEKIAKDIVKGYKGIMSKRYRFISEVITISMGLFLTVPVTCHALNWVYPRFMEIFLPNLAGVKKDPVAANKNGGEK